jgi:hypothetical protein
VAPSQTAQIIFVLGADQFRQCNQGRNFGQIHVKGIVHVRNLEKSRMKVGFQWAPFEKKKKKEGSFQRNQKVLDDCFQRKSDSRETPSTEVFAFGANSDSQLANNAVDSSTATPVLIRSLPPSIVVQKVRLSMSFVSCAIFSLSMGADFMWCCTRILAFEW